MVLNAKVATIFRGGEGVYMLKESHKTVVEQIALEFQKVFRDDEINELKPVKYNIEKLMSYVRSMGCDFKFGQPENKTDEKIIYFTFTDGDLVNNVSGCLKIFFHEVWHYIVFYLNLLPQDENKELVIIETENEETVRYSRDEFSTSLDEMSAAYFSRAMLMPEKNFFRCVFEYTDIKGTCNIFKVAEIFNVEFTDVIGRGNDLNLWNKKVGI